MRRRLVLSQITLLLPPLAGCAGGTAKPPREPLDIARLGLLPIKEWEPTGSTAPFSINLLSATKISNAGPPINPSQLGMAIGNSLRASQAASREQLAYALTALDFSARTSLTQAVQEVLHQRALRVVDLDDGALATAVRDNRFGGLPQSVDAILDLQIHGAGYYPAKLGLVPYLSLGARVLGTKAPAGVVEEFWYEVNHGDAKGDPRFFSTPPELITSSLSSFRQNAEPLRSGLNVLFRRVAEQLGTDVQRLVDKQPRV